MMGLNPLHCGAVVASLRRGDRVPASEEVSIPFIAGQWSLLTPMAKTKTKTKSFNPLHCGAVVASPAVRRLPRPAASGFNPLHCGAVVASRDARLSPDDLAEFQSPSLRGSGRFRGDHRGGDRHPLVSIPFIAGQWSLPPHGGVRPKQKNGVSIPFIAGQWSLLTDVETHGKTVVEFQSPSLRGSGRFCNRRRRIRYPPFCFNPLHCGAVVASVPRHGAVRRRRRSFNPLHCGAVVASSKGAGARAGRGGSFNPLHCGAVVASCRL